MPDAARKCCELLASKSKLAWRAQQPNSLIKVFLIGCKLGCRGVRSKIAVSMDGRTALANGVSQWITGADARADVHRWRARSGAILTGIGTVSADNPSLTARIPAEHHNDRVIQPLRVIVDSALRISLDAQLLADASNQEAAVLIVHSRGSAESAAALTAMGVEVVELPRSSEEGGERVSLRAVLSLLGNRDINDVWVEAGAELNGALLVEDLIDELWVYQAAHILGNDAQGHVCDIYARVYAATT